MRTKIFSLFLLLFFSVLVQALAAQSAMKPVHAYWKADGKTVSLSKGYHDGTEQPSELTFVMFFDQNVLKRYSKSHLTFEFTWFHYYSTQKEYMDSYTVRYNGANISDSNKYVVTSKRGNILPGWWEVRVRALYDNKAVHFKGLDKFQILIK